MRYHTSGIQSGVEGVFTSPYHKSPELDEALELRVLTPVFYFCFIQYVDDMDAVTAELNIHRTIWVDKPQLLPCIFGNMSLISQPMSFVNRYFASILRRLRHRPRSVSFGSTLQDPSRTYNVTGERKEDRMSKMDAFIMLDESKELGWRYRWATFRQLVADRYFVGRTGLFDRISDIVRIGIVWAFIELLGQTTTRVGGFHRV